MSARMTMAGIAGNKLHDVGAHSLSDADLLSALIRSSQGPKRASEIAERLLAEAGNLSRLATLEPAHLQKLGLRPVTSSRVLAAFEISRRIAEVELGEKQFFSKPEKVAAYLAQTYCLLDQEVLGALYLDARHRLLVEEEIFRGTLTQASVEPRPILRKALLRGSSGIIVWHSHPTSDTTPSEQDLAFTERMTQAGEILGIRLVDHLVIGTEGTWTSLRRETVLGKHARYMPKSKVAWLTRRRGHS